MPRGKRVERAGKERNLLERRKIEPALRFAERDKAVEMVEHGGFVEERQHSVLPLAKERKQFFAKTDEAVPSGSERAFGVSKVVAANHFQRGEAYAVVKMRNPREQQAEHALAERPQPC
ncbi:hypothetical protein SDC9_90238 [bioreactor metagenome]|uniref:Uncharacterized protein n=1 Tax=bioreactor metagenome TaxID=1076179 RepID=A0A644ZUJ9_9ZZZZ